MFNAKLWMMAGLTLGSITVGSAQAKTTVLHFSDGDGGGFLDPLVSLKGLKSIFVWIDFYSGLTGTPVTNTASTFDLQSTIVADSTVLGIHLPTSSTTQDYGVYAFDPNAGYGRGYGSGGGPPSAQTTINYAFTKGDLATVVASNPTVGSLDYFLNFYPVSVTAFDIFAGVSVDYVLGSNDASSNGTLTIVTTPEPAAIAFIGLGVLGIALRQTTRSKAAQVDLGPITN